MTWPLAARGQELARIRRIGVLSPLAENDPEAQANVSAFRQALEMLSWTDGRNLHIDYRWGSGDSERIRAYARTSRIPQWRSRSRCRRDATGLRQSRCRLDR
jgi:hypothetical protein